MSGQVQPGGEPSWLVEVGLFFPDDHPFSGEEPGGDPNAIAPDHWSSQSGTVNWCEVLILSFLCLNGVNFLGYNV